MPRAFRAAPLTLIVPLVLAACSPSAPETRALSPEMSEAIDTFVKWQIKPTSIDGGVTDTKGGTTAPPTSKKNSRLDLGLGVDPVKVGSAMTAGATGIPAGGVALSPNGAGNGGVGGAPIVGGVAGSPVSGGLGGVALGSAASGGVASFAQVACDFVQHLCGYIARCSSNASVSGVCSVPSTCPALVTQALAEAGLSAVPPQVVTLLKCFDSKLQSASCVTRSSDFSATFGSCGYEL